ncbi:hypothetical protein GCM10011490_23190 [Pseudoclavibacter endophyticus]|nr:hypothetical protein GCM10011490_23190 [Pseudoclavibacter endophyticus]
MVEWMLERVVETAGERPDRVALTHPPSWGAFRVELVRDALAERGLEGIHLVSEPIAAAQHYALTRNPGPGTAIAIYDLGGGSFDATVLRADEDGRFAVVGAPVSIPVVGGTDFEHEVRSHVLAHSGPITETAAGPDAETDAATRREATALRRDCAAAVAALSDETETSIPVATATGPTSVRLVRGEYEAMIEARVGETVEALQRAIEASGIAVDDLAAIVLVGGAAQTPVVAQQLSATFGRPIVIDDEPQLAGAYGAAALAAEFAIAEFSIAEFVAAESGADAEATELRVDDDVVESQLSAVSRRRARRATFRAARGRPAAGGRRRIGARGALIGGTAATLLAAVLVTPAIAFALSVAGPLADAGSRELGESRPTTSITAEGSGPVKPDGGAGGDHAGGGGTTPGDTSSGGTSSGGTSPHGGGSSSGAPEGSAPQPPTGGQHSGAQGETPNAQAPAGSPNGDSAGDNASAPAPAPTQQPPAPSPAEPSPAGAPPAPAPDPDAGTPTTAPQHEGDPGQ